MQSTFVLVCPKCTQIPNVVAVVIAAVVVVAAAVAIVVVGPLAQLLHSHSKGRWCYWCHVTLEDRSCSRQR